MRVTPTEAGELERMRRQTREDLMRLMRTGFSATYSGSTGAGIMSSQSLSIENHMAGGKLKVGNVYRVTLDLMADLKVGDKIIALNQDGSSYGPDAGGEVGEIALSPDTSFDRIFIFHNDASQPGGSGEVAPESKGFACSWCIEPGKLIKIVKLKKEDKEEPTKLNLEAFNSLTLPTEFKEEIIATLRQHSHRDKIMNQWGLGEVIEYGHGTAMLFWGKPGTGKTWAGKIIAKVLGQELKVIGTAELQSNVPGEFERNVKKVFALAKQKKHVLLIDECDGLVQSRMGMGQIMSAENNTLMQEIEQFDGVCILTTNRADSLDEALERRMALILEFPMPNFDQRLEIWNRFLPKKLPLAEDVVKDKIAEYALTGGQIKNAVLNAARHAVSRESEKVEMADFERAIKRIQTGSKAFSGPRSGVLAGARFIGGNADKVRESKTIDISRS